MSGLSGPNVHGISNIHVCFHVSCRTDFCLLRDVLVELATWLIYSGFVETPATSINNFKMPFLITAEEAATIIFTRIYKKGFEISFPFPFNFMMKFGSILPYKVYFKITEYISRNEQKN